MSYEYLYRRRHQNYLAAEPFWRRALAAYSGGQTYLDQALIRHVSEALPEFMERRARAYYLNYPRKIARAITQYVLAQTPRRERADAGLCEDFSRSGLRVNEVMRQFSTCLNIFGSAWMLVDMPGFAGELDAAEQAAERIRPYAVVLNPLEVPDWAFGSDGRLLWAIVSQNSVDNRDPFSEPVAVCRRTLWTRERWRVIAPDAGGECRITAEGCHGLGRVPLVRYEETDGNGINANHWFEDVIKISDAILNNESEAQMNAVKQMFGLIVIGERFANQAKHFKSQPNSNGAEDSFSHILARSSALIETPDEKGISRYISPSGIETKTLREENIALKKELFDIVGLAIQKDNRTEQSAESKAWDHLHVGQFLATRADILEQVENQTWQFFHAWDSTITLPQVCYNREFAQLEMNSTITAILGLATINGGKEYQREIARAAAAVLNRVTGTAPQNYQQIIAEIAAMEAT
jgi:hypothetical protein